MAYKIIQIIEGLGGEETNKFVAKRIVKELEGELPQGTAGILTKYFGLPY